MTAEVDTIASNVSRLAIRRENASEWLTLKPVSYADFGAETEKEENQVIEPGRNREKEVSVGINAPAGFKANFTPESLGHFADGVFLVTEKATPSSGGRFGSGTPTVVATGFDIGTDAAAAGFIAGQLVYAEFWGESGNNGLHVVTGTLANVVQVSGLTVEGSPPSDAYVKVVGHQFDAADVDVVVTGGSYPTLVSTANAFNTADLIPGMWIYSGGGSAGSNQFNTDGNSGVKHLTEQTLTLSNNAVIEDAHGEFGALEIVPGDFSFAVEMTAHFADVAAQAAVQNNLDIGYQLGYANTMRDRRAGVIFDCPRGSLGNGRNNVERNSSIKTPLTFSGARSDTFGYAPQRTSARASQCELGNRPPSRTR